MVTYAVGKMGELGRTKLSIFDYVDAFADPGGVTLL